MGRGIVAPMVFKLAERVMPQYKERFMVAVGAVAEWVRVLDWRQGGPGFESCWGNFALELWQFRLPRFRRRH